MNSIPMETEAERSVRDEQDEIERSTWELLQEIRESHIYREYREQEEKLRADPALAKRVRAFRAANFHMQQGSRDVDVDWVHNEQILMRRIPEVNEYLDAELDLCRLVQKICRTLTEGLEFDTPDL